ncbi:hypothetical protein GCM10025865_13860 [Paraoerskovia sediminicola]|uniref:Uncharacterized protein n=1 Tax=Paraoerskovia sediminicola TaxID=1138587 RepID=A0ABM8G212_9CELL|nr:hypothetical protein GCM10025865_13860 [Paraoerskovia sediminicola]
MLVRHGDRGVADERRPTGEHLEEEAARGVEVAAGVDGLAARLLGERYCAVPMTDWVCVIVAAESAMARAIPKSMTFTVPVGVIITFAGLMSRWTIPAWCEYSSAESTPAAISTASSMGTECPSRTMSRTVWPSTYSMTMNGTCVVAPCESVPASSPVS